MAEQLTHGRGVDIALEKILPELFLDYKYLKKIHILSTINMANWTVWDCNEFMVSIRKERCEKILGQEQHSAALEIQQNSMELSSEDDEEESNNEED
jgi:hypothetical protein